MYIKLPALWYDMVSNIVVTAAEFGWLAVNYYIADASRRGP